MLCEVPCWGRGGVVRAVAIVDPSDYVTVSPHRWHLTAAGYAERAVKRPGHVWGKVLMHREILGLAPGDRLEVDHVSGDKLDNRRCNLRVVTKAQNGQNVPARGGASRYRGVYRDRESGRWYGQVSVGGRRYCTPRRASEAEVNEDVITLRAQLMTHANEARSVAA